MSKARAIVVIWTKNSVGSDWVQSEAGRALNERKLIPVRSVEVEYKDIPPPFDNVHTLPLNNREQILAAVAGQLAKPAEPAPRWKVFRFKLLEELGVIGGAITLVSIIGGIIHFSNYFRWLFNHWSALLKYCWSWLFFIKISGNDAENLTLCLLLTSALFYSSINQPATAVSQPTPTTLRAWLNQPRNRLAFWCICLLTLIQLLGTLDIARRVEEKHWREFDAKVDGIFANSPECGSFMKSLVRKYRPLKPAFWEDREEDVDVFDIFKEAHRIVVREEYDTQKLREKGWSETIIKTAVCFNSATGGVKPLDLFSMSLLIRDVTFGQHLQDFLVKGITIEGWIGGPGEGPDYLRAIPGLFAHFVANVYWIYVPFVLYWILSYIFPLKLDGSVLGRRLSRTLMAFGGIIALNYVAVGLERAREWLKTLPDLN